MYGMYTHYIAYILTPHTESELDKGRKGNPLPWTHLCMAKQALTNTKRKCTVYTGPELNVSVVIFAGASRSVLVTTAGN